MRRHENHITNTAGQPRKLEILAWTVGGLILGLAAVNLLLSAALTGVIYPGVRLADRSVALKTRAEATTLLRGVNASHKITIRIGERTYRVSSEQLGAKRDDAVSVDTAYQVGRTTPFPLVGIAQALRSNPARFSYRLDAAKLERFTQQLTNDIGRSPVNAKIEVVNGEFVTTPDQDGVAIDQTKLTQTLQAALGEGADKSVALEPTSVKADVVLAATAPVVAEAKSISQQSLTFTYQDRTFRPDAATIASWLVFPAEKNSASGKVDLHAAIDDAKIRGYLQSLANEINVAPVTKKVTIKNGVSQTDQEGQDGLAVNQDDAFTAVKKALTDKAALAYTVTTRPVAYKTQYNRVTTLDIGRYIEINLSTQQLWVYQDNQVIYTSPITSGATGMGFPTVTGLFSIYSKAQNIWLDGRAYGDRYNYRVLVDYWMPFYGGFGLHDAWRWRSTFGGADYYYNGSHGCVNLPLATAAFIYNWAEIGTPVWVHT